MAWSEDPLSGGDGWNPDSPPSGEIGSVDAEYTLKQGGQFTIKKHDGTELLKVDNDTEAIHFKGGSANSGYHPGIYNSQQEGAGSNGLSIDKWGIHSSQYVGELDKTLIDGVYYTLGETGPKHHIPAIHCNKIFGLYDLDPNCYHDIECTKTNEDSLPMDSRTQIEISDMQKEPFNSGAATHTDTIDYKIRVNAWSSNIKLDNIKNGLYFRSHASNSDRPRSVVKYGSDEDWGQASAARPSVRRTQCIPWLNTRDLSITFQSNTYSSGTWYLGGIISVPFAAGSADKPTITPGGFEASFIVQKLNTGNGPFWSFPVDYNLNIYRIDIMYSKTTDGGTNTLHDVEWDLGYMDLVDRTEQSVSSAENNVFDNTGQEWTSIKSGTLENCYDEKIQLQTYDNGEEPFKPTDPHSGAANNEYTIASAPLLSAANAGGHGGQKKLKVLMLALRVNELGAGYPNGEVIRNVFTAKVYHSFGMVDVTWD